ncbi:alcohol acetyltransferase-domain-containing protein [Xylariomycetidae sp. FL0641]|nr:alcohol acetyltransferase-domain-containing protein [Xylariomycetidae sp. FL0641]
MGSSKGHTRPMQLYPFGHNTSERYFQAMYNLGQYRGTLVGCQYVIPPRLRPLDMRDRLMQLVTRALVEIIEKHPMLRVGIEGAGSKWPKWVQLPSINLKDHIEWRFIDGTLEDFDNASRQAIVPQVDATFPDLESRPGWRALILLRTQETDFLDLMFTFNHVNMDGIGGKIFHEDVLRSLHTAQQQPERALPRDGTLKLPDKPLELPPPVEKLDKLPVDLATRLKISWHYLRPGFLCRDPGLARWAPIRAEPYKTQYRDFFLPPDALERVLAACRHHNTTLTGLLHALTLVSLSSHLSAAAALAFQAQTPINTRQFIASPHPKHGTFDPARAAANYVTLLDHSIGAAAVSRIRSTAKPDLLDQIWTSAAQFGGEIRRKRAQGLRNDLMGLMGWTSDWRAQMRATARRPRQPSWWVTNLGVFDGGPGQEWSVRRARFATGAYVVEPAFVVSTISVKGGDLCVGGSWQDCVVSTELGGRVVEDLEGWLGQIAAGEEVAPSGLS